VVTHYILKTMSPDFDEILSGAQVAEEWAIGALYEEFQPRLLKYLAFRAPQVAEDVASEIWIKVARGLPRFTGDEIEFRAWLFTIARHALIDWRRHEQRRPEQAAEPIAFVGMTDPVDTEESALEAVSTAAALRTIALLPPDQADVVLLRVVAGLDAAQVGRIMGKPPGTIRVLQHRALQRLVIALGATRELDEGVTR
jgi:RNA polymerase sigma-70 factor (ECF subfamily)